MNEWATYTVGPLWHMRQRKHVIWMCDRTLCIARHAGKTLLHMESYSTSHKEPGNSINAAVPCALTTPPPCTWHGKIYSRVVDEGKRPHVAQRQYLTTNLYHCLLEVSELCCCSLPQFDNDYQFNSSVKTLLSRLPKQRYLKSICDELHHFKIIKK